jgi:hypothetical protein
MQENIRANFGNNSTSTIKGGQGAGTPSSQVGTAPDQYGAIVLKARSILERSQSGLAPKAAKNTGGNTNLLKMDKTIGDLADLVETTFDPVWKETYRVALVRCLAAAEDEKGGVRDVSMYAASIKDAGQQPDTFSHPAVGIVAGLDVSAWSARQAGYQQRFNAPPAALPPPFLPVDPIAGGNEYNQRDVPGLGTTAIPTVQHGGHYFSQRGTKPLGTSHK